MTEHTAHAAVARGPIETARETAGGISVTFVLLTQMLTLGLIAYGTLGPVAVESGVRAAFAAAIFGVLSAAVLGGALLPNEIPRASTVLVFAAFVSRLEADPALRALEGGGIDAILFLSALCLALGGLIQVAFGMLRLGSIARFVPYPVVAGLMTGLAISLIFYELPHILGTHAEGGHHETAPQAEAGAHGAEAGHAGWQPWTLLVALFTIATVVVVEKRWPKAPAKLIGVAAGTLLAVGISLVAHGIDFGPRLPHLSHALPGPDALFPLISASGLRLAWKYAYELFISAAAIAVIGSLDSLLAAVGEMDGPLDTGHQPNRLLIALGLGNVMSGLFGGVPLAYSSHHALVSGHGARRMLPSLVTALTLVLLLLYGAPLLQLIPVAVLAGVMTVIAFGLISNWAGAIVKRARRQQYDRELMVNIALVLLVSGVTIFFGLVPAVLTGLIVSMALFIAMMNRSLVRSVSTGETRASRRVYPPEQAKLLRAEGGRIKVLEIDGAIFFGTADRLGAEAQRAAAGASFLIVDLRRVTMIDASGALMMERLQRSLREHNIKLLFAHLSVGSPLARALHAAGAFPEKHHPDWFVDGDRALEWAERQILSQLHVPDSKHEIRIDEFALMSGLSAAELEFIKHYLDRQLLPPQAALYHEGEAGDRLFLLARGAVSLMAGDHHASPAKAANDHHSGAHHHAGAYRSTADQHSAADHHPTVNHHSTVNHHPTVNHRSGIHHSAAKARRILTLAPGVIFGESSVLEGGAHSVTAISEEEVVLYSLSRNNLDAIRAANPDLYRRLLVNLLAYLSGLLRMTTGVLREEGDSVR